VQAAAYRAAASEAAFQVLLFIGAFLRHTCSRKGRRHPSRRMLLAKYQDIDAVPVRRFNSLFGFTALKRK
jgi:hypothetical protein